MRRFLIPAAATALLCAAAPASSAPVSPAGVYEAGRCIVSQDRNAAVALIRSLPLDSDAADLSGLRGRAANCARGAAGASAMMVRGAIAQALFFRDFHRFGPPPQYTTRVVDLGLPVETSPEGNDELTELYRWTDCVVRNDTPNTERLLRSPVGSAEEGAALEALRTYMSVCMSDGAQRRLATWEARSLFAQSAYHTMYRYHTGELDAAPRNRRH